ncbi:MAG TPA: FAD-binding oxidoreductase [Albidovulum sp.]|uniref:FAD-binding oxidoreductase n=1 Tax=Albidovulum sp. TaxID=1872424 RepID=UPI002CC4266F|nr:FAD-binding oxidoreductase [Albidovulum sp.]
MPAGADPSLAVLLNGFAIAELVAWIVTEFIAPRLRRRTFTVERVSRHGDTTTVTLLPKGRTMRWRPGQFAFLSAPEAGLAEPHPFTITSAPAADGHITFAIRALDGWTRRLPGALRKGMVVRVEGPHGRLGQNPRRVRFEQFDFARGPVRMRKDSLHPLPIPVCSWAAYFPTMRNGILEHPLRPEPKSNPGEDHADPQAPHRSSRGFCPRPGGPRPRRRANQCP